MFRRGRKQSDFNAEVEAHLELEVERLREQGMSAEEARSDARRNFGNVTQTQERFYESSRWVWWEQLWRDLRYGLRMLARSPGLTVAAVLTLALGIGATAVLFSILDSVYFHFPGPASGNQVIVLFQHFQQEKFATSLFSPAEYADIAGYRRSFDGFFAVSHSNPALTENEVGGNPERVPVVHATANMFPLYGIPPVAGRVYAEEEDRPGGPSVAVLTDRLWKRRFGRDPGVVGRIVRLDGLPFTVIGVMPEGFQEWGADIYVPLDLDPSPASRSTRTLTVAGVAARGLSPEQTAPALRGLARRIEAQYAAANPEYRGLTYEPWGVREGVVGDLRIALIVLLGAVGLLLLIAAANIANLLLARTLARVREIGTRLALGATPGQLARQFLTESLLLSTVAGLLGFLLGGWAMPTVLALIPEHYIGEGTAMRASPAAFFLSLLVAVVLGVAFGMAPAMLTSGRGVAANLGQSRTDEGRHRLGRRARSMLVLAEVTLAFVVVTSAGLMVRAYREITSMDLGYQPDHVLTLRIPLSASKYAGNGDGANFLREVVRRVRPLPGVADVAAASARPMDSISSRQFSIPGQQLSTADGNATAVFRVITPDYFTVIQTRLEKGRFFTEQDGPGTSRVAIVNQKFEQTYFSGQSAVGRQINLKSRFNGRVSFGELPDSDMVEVVGVVQDSRQLSQWSPVHDLYNPASPEIFVPFWQHPEAGRDIALLVRTQTDPSSVAESVRQQVLKADPGQPVYDIELLRTLANLTLGPARLCLLLLGIFAVVAMATACVGLYAVISYTVRQRSHEFGIRIALGAARQDILRLVIREGMLVVAAGLAAGIVGSFGAARVMSSLLYRVPSNDLATPASTAALLFVVALLACYVPARRATKVDPLVALRHE